MVTKQDDERMPTGVMGPQP